MPPTIRGAAAPCALALTVLLASGCAVATPEGSLGAELFETCVPCHGTTGAGNPDIEAPSVAGLPAWYVVAQLEGFKAGMRGDHHADLPGLRMRPMAMTLREEADVQAVAGYVASLAPVVTPGAVEGNAGAGAQTYQVCTVCHGADAMGNELLHAPPLANANDWYLLQELQNFKVGARGAHPGDTWGATMRPNAMQLDDDAMRNVIAYIRTLR